MLDKTSTNDCGIDGIKKYHRRRCRKDEANFSHSSLTHRYRTKEQNILEWQQITFYRLINKHCYDSTSIWTWSENQREQKSKLIMKFHCCTAAHNTCVWFENWNIWKFERERERENYAGQYLSELIINSNRWNQSILCRLFDVRLWSVKRGYKFFFPSQVSSISILYSTITNNKKNPKIPRHTNSISINMNFVNKWNVYVSMSTSKYGNIFSFWWFADATTTTTTTRWRRRLWFDYIYSFHFFFFFNRLNVKLPSMTCKFLALNEKKNHTHSQMVFSSEHVLVLFVGVMLSCDFVLGIIFFFSWKLLKYFKYHDTNRKKNTQNRNVCLMHLTNNLLFVPIIIIKSIDTWWNGNGSIVRRVSDWAREHDKKREWIIQEGPCSTYW